MSAWRRKALALFPELREELEAPEATADRVFWELFTRAVTAHQLPQDAPFLAKLHGYAEWCLRQSGDLWRMAGIGFYEDLFATVTDWNLLTPWLSPFAIEQIQQTWALQYPDRRADFEQLLRERQAMLYRTTVYATGEIEAL